MLPASALVLALVGAPAPSVDWRAPAGCPDQDQVLALAQELMAAPSVEEAMHSVSVAAAIEVAAVGFTLEIDVRTPSGTTHRTMSADDCMMLARVAALMIAVAIDPVQAAKTQALGSSPASSEPTEHPETPPSEELPTRGDANPPTPSPPRDPTPPISRAGGSAVGGLVRASGSVGRGIVPELDGRVAVGTGLLGLHLRAELFAFHVLTQRTRYDDLPEVGGSVAAWGGAARVGPRFELSAFELHALAGVAVAALTAAGFGVDRPSQSTDAWIALDLSLGLRWVPSPRFALGIDLEGLVAVRRPTFVVDTLPPVYRAGRVGIRGAVVTEFRFGRSGV